MNNFEWLKNEIANADKDELREIIESSMPWCATTPTDKCTSDCEECANKWFEEIHEEPMPELKTGMFVKNDNGSIGVVVDNKIIYQCGTYSSNHKVDKPHIVAVYTATCFNNCVDRNIIWRRSE